MVRNKKKWPVLVMLAVIIPGVITGIVGIYLVSQQRNARLPLVKQDYTNRLNLLRQDIETTARQQMENAFLHIEANPSGLISQTTLSNLIKTLLLQYPLVKYPFLISTSKGFLFPFSQKARLSPDTSPALEPEKHFKGTKAKAFYKKGFDLEYTRKNYIEAIRAYLWSLDAIAKNEEAVKPYILDAIARSYGKQGLFPQAITYYRKLLDFMNRNKKEDSFLYFTALRQTAVSYRQMGDNPEAVKWYLRLYEEAPQGDSLTQAGPFEFYKNEALDYLNRFTQKQEGNEQTTRFSRAKARDKLEKASEVDITLRWFYFETDTPNSSETDGNAHGENESRFFKLRELYESNDEKTRFYHLLNTPGFWSAETDTPSSPTLKDISIKTRLLENVTGNQDAEICYKPVIRDHPELGTVYFGFIPSTEYLRNELVPGLARERFDSPDLSVAVQRNNTNFNDRTFLISTPILSMFQEEQLLLLSMRSDFFESEVAGEIRLYYGLWAALVIVLGLGIFIFYKYVSREARLVQLKSQFVDSVSHTLKTPLTRMSLLAENLQQGWVSDESQKKQYLGIIIRETARMNEMIENMLNFSRIEEEKQYYEPQPVFLQEEAAVLIDGYAEDIRNQGFKLETEFDESLPAVMVDPKAIKLILGNLLQNAVKYSPNEKFIRIRVYRENDFAVLEISDRGIGISSEHIRLLFRKFSRIPDSRVRAIEGSGLGLFLIKHAVDFHKGRIEVESVINQGTIFKVFLGLQH